MGFFEKLFGSSNNEKDKIILKYIEISKALGISHAEATNGMNNMVDEALSDLPENIDPYAKKLGYINIKDKDFMAPRLKAGLTPNDIQNYWNQTPLSNACEISFKTFTDFIIIKTKESQGLSLAQAALFARSNFVRYGVSHDWDKNDAYNVELTENDIELYPEFRTRVENWHEKNHDEISAIVKEYGTINAAIWSFIKKGAI